MARMPLVFSEIIKNDNLRKELQEKAVSDSMTHDDWEKLRLLVEDRKNLRASAERALRHNTNKRGLT